MFIACKKVSLPKKTKKKKQKNSYICDAYLAAFIHIKQSILRGRQSAYKAKRRGRETNTFSVAFQTKPKHVTLDVHPLEGMSHHADVLLWLLFFFWPLLLLLLGGYRNAHDISSGKQVVNPIATVFRTTADRLSWLKHNAHRFDPRRGRNMGNMLMMWMIGATV